ncbi:hypothetical protein UG46_25365 [Pseudomonas fluorescens]|uniref:hypothetical protein n=1 Tax=Pseudomonas fluorescens TaxID=294 RepID=UPI0005E83855|nr:hypothetical protein [Pseudomonas fluorescens]KJH81080.1 hypothetical protein UG46_25365 [Pseudomonas fluorescens]
MNFPDITDFESGNWNGWGHSEGISGNLDTEEEGEGENTFWKGVVRLHPGPNPLPQFRASLKKTFIIQDNERDDSYSISFNFRVNPLQSDEATYMSMTFAGESDFDYQTAFHFLDANTRPGEWHKAEIEPKKWFIYQDTIRFGVRGFKGEGSDFRRIEIDNIEIWKADL